ncbi:hypothetical protein JTE90_009556 [Oedothorax gibbosus]|uniref:Uncharacterized protein n=1 Tax=Oedothorax gibbosus TaxID=931172 RepID=A0AAV6UZ11_9ARAC|nr:hypothetical protein JTE90_009556 [Oedothorax gibbosus]
MGRQQKEVWQDVFSNESLKFNFAIFPQLYWLKMSWFWTLSFLILCCCRLNTASNCFNSPNIECTCNTDSVTCNGIQQEYLEAHDLLANISSIYSSQDLLYLDLDIRNLNFPSDFNFTGFKLKNLTIGTDLQHINDDLFSGLSLSLRSLCLQDNNISFINNQSFSQLFNLEELKLYSNEIHDINSNAFLNLGNLEYLNLAENKLNQIDSNILEKLPAIQELVLTKNNFSSLSNINIVSATLKRLVAQNCAINGSVTEESLSGVSNLEHADFSFNLLTSIESYSMSSLNQLKVLNLSSNQLEKLEHNAFSSMYNLRILDLKKNKLLLITKTSFLNLTSLNYLDLSHNLLQAVLGEYTSDLHSLNHINLEYNNIKIIMPGTFSTNPNLKKLSLIGNSYDCICELSYFVDFLLNNSLTIDVEDMKNLKCSSPAASKGTPLVIFDFTPLNCDNKEETDDYDYESSETESTENGITDPMNSTEVQSTTDLIVTTNVLSTTQNLSSISPTTEEMTSTTGRVSTTLMEIKPITDEHNNSTTEEIQTTTPTFTSTTENIHSSTNVISIKKEIATTIGESNSTAEEIHSTTIQESNTTTEEIHSITPEISSTTEGVYSSTKVISYTAEIETTTKEITSTTQELSAVTFHSTSENLNISTTAQAVTSTISHSSTVPITLGSKSAPELSVTILEHSVLDTDFCVRWRLSGITFKPTCSIRLNTVEGSRSKILKCPTDGNEIRQCLSSKTVYEFCISIFIQAKLGNKVCNKVPVTSTEVKTVSSETTITSIDETEVTTNGLSTKASEETTKELSTTTSLKPPLRDPVVFKIISFDATFHYSNFSALIKWGVNKPESETICKLTLILITNQYNHTEGTFKCQNKTYQMINIKEENAFKLCLEIMHDSYKSNLICQFHSGLSYELKASKTKDSGFKNWSLIAVLCLLVVVSLIIIGIVLKKLLKKRTVGERYNVYDQEQNVKQRTSLQFQQEPCVRYSYTPQEHI